MFINAKEISDQARIRKKNIIRKWLKEGKDRELLWHLVANNPRVKHSYEDLAIYGVARTKMTQKSSGQLLAYAVRYLRRLKKYCI